MAYGPHAWEAVTGAWLALGTVSLAAEAEGLELGSVITPILSTGMVGVFLLMVVFRVKIMPTYVHDEALAAKDAAHAVLLTQLERERDRLAADLATERAALAAAGDVYTQQVIPTLTRVLDAERELLELRRDEQAERRRRGE